MGCDIKTYTMITENVLVNSSSSLDIKNDPEVKLPSDFVRRSVAKSIVLTMPLRVVLTRPVSMHALSLTTSLGSSEPNSEIEINSLLFPQRVTAISSFMSAPNLLVLIFYFLDGE